MIIPIEPLNDAHAMLIIEAFNVLFIIDGGEANGDGDGDVNWGDGDGSGCSFGDRNDLGDGYGDGANSGYGCSYGDRTGGGWNDDANDEPFERIVE